MSLLKGVALLWLVDTLIPFVQAQGTPTTTSAQNPATLLTTVSSSNTPGTQPTPTDDAPKGNDNHESDSSGLVQYYFVFFALLVCIVGLAIFFMVRRRHQRMSRMRNGREEALQQDLTVTRYGVRWDGAGNRRRYWQGRWRSAEASREEGLNEHGEAPPPYLPKRRSEEAQRSEGEESGEPAVPLQTLSRDAAGLKPPDYSEVYQEEVDPHGRGSVASASSSRQPDPQTRSP